jgi:hypothetical protein
MKNPTLTLSELLNSYTTNPQAFLCHSVRAVLAEKNGVGNWGHLKISNLEEKLHTQLRNHAPYLFVEIDFSVLSPDKTVLDYWLNWGYVCLIDELDGLWRYSHIGNGEECIQMNVPFRQNLLAYILKHDGDFELTF